MEARPNPTSAMPIGVIEKMSRPALPERSSRLSASRKAGALTRVRVVPSEAAKDIGISSREADSQFALAKRVRSGSIIAVTMTWRLAESHVGEEGGGRWEERGGQ